MQRINIYTSWSRFQQYRSSKINKLENSTLEFQDCQIFISLFGLVRKMFYFSLIIQLTKTNNEFSFTFTAKPNWFIWLKHIIIVIIFEKSFKQFISINHIIIYDTLRLLVSSMNFRNLLRSFITLFYVMLSAVCFKSQFRTKQASFFGNFFFCLL